MSANSLMPVCPNAARNMHKAQSTPTSSRCGERLQLLSVRDDSLPQLGRLLYREMESWRAELTSQSPSNAEVRILTRSLGLGQSIGPQKC